MRRRLGGLLAAFSIVCATMAGTAADAWAGFRTTSQASHTLTSGRLQAPSGLSVTTGCSLLVLGPKADLQWTATPSLFATGYKVERWRGSTLEATVTVVPRTNTILTQTGLRRGTTYTWRVYAYYQSWTSSVTSASRTTPSLCL
ncbi:MAG TPA: fibronectin type III domain-containing protein [Acidimicrobiales bacterium]|nr:fibronectin type III domain-containing protein [Acidimicrobiales bacterium]